MSEIFVPGKILERVKKFLALTENNENEHECRAAQAAADKLIQEYRISQAALEALGEIKSEPFIKKVVSTGGRRLLWKEIILMELCAHYGGAFYFSSVRVGGEGGTPGRKGSEGIQSYTVIARESDAEVISYMLTYLANETDRISRNNCVGQGVKVAASYRVGFASGIASQFKDLRAATRDAAQGSSAMVLLDKRELDAKAEMERAMPNLRTGARITGGRDAMARMNGFIEGKKVQIKQGLGGGSTSLKLTS